MELQCNALVSGVRFTTFKRGVRHQTGVGWGLAEERGAGGWGGSGGVGGEGWGGGGGQAKARATRDGRERQEQQVCINIKDFLLRLSTVAGLWTSGSGRSLPRLPRVLE